MYVDYEYYLEEYHGTMSSVNFSKFISKAEAYIRYLTYAKGDAFAQKTSAVWNAVCAVADVYEQWEEKRKIQSSNGASGIVKSENNDGYSVSYVTEQTDGQIAENVLKKKCYEASYMYLLPAGWLFRKAGWNHADQCRYHSL